MREGVAAVEVLGVPLLALLESGRFALFSFGKGQFLHRHLLGSERAAVVGRLHIADDNIVRGAVADDMVHVEEPIDMLRVAHHFCMKQPAAIELVRHDEFLLLSLDVGNLFDSKAELLLFQIEALEGLSVVIHPNPGEESGVGLYGCLNGTAQAVGIKAAVKDKEERQVIKNLIVMAYAFRLNAILRFG